MLVGGSCTSSVGPLMPAHKSLHFLQGDGAVVVGIHRLEYALVSRAVDSGIF
jgi:hypothetical protein